MLNFLQSLLNPNPDARLTANDAVKHPWLTFDHHIPLVLPANNDAPQPQGHSANRGRRRSTPATLHRRNRPKPQRSHARSDNLNQSTRVNGARPRSCNIL